MVWQPLSEQVVPRRILAIDVGAGTQDILLYESGQPIENSVKMVMPSRTVIVARLIEQVTDSGRALFLTGNLMGGGPSSEAVRRHIAAGLEVYATPLAAKTIHDNLDIVQSMGVVITDEAPAEAAIIETGDVDLSAIRAALGQFEVELPDEFAVAVQDHGESPFRSNRRFRFEHWEEFIQRGGALTELAYRSVPSHLTRMRAVQRDVPGALVMDTGAAAIWGALGDEEAASHRSRGLIVANIGNQHVLAALVQGDRLWGLFEHHTRAMDRGKLAEYVVRLRSRGLPNEEVLNDGGHGAVVHPDFQAGEGFQLVVVTGPNRHLARGLGYHEAVPYGDMMLSGCFGLLAACGIDLRKDHGFAG